MGSCTHVVVFVRVCVSIMLATFMHLNFGNMVHTRETGKYDSSVAIPFTCLTGSPL